MKEIGGYFELELPPGNNMSELPPGILVNSGRHALEYILRCLGKKVRRVWLPYYTCDVVLEPIRRLNLDCSFYNIDPNLEIAIHPQIGDGDYIIVNNYFGIKDRYIAEMSDKYKDQLIVDNAQALYCMPQTGVHAIYSPRKFFGVPDGGIVHFASDLYLDIPASYSYGRCSHLLKRIDSDASSGYEDFRRNSRMLKDEQLTKMSMLTERVLGSIDFEIAKTKRQSNFRTLHAALIKTNQLSIPYMEDFSCPMVYPYLTDDKGLRRRLIENKIFVATYWPNVFEWCNKDSIENHIAKHMLPLPIDQRYDIEDMNRILRIILAN